MDVTSLLNSNNAAAAAAEQLKQQEQQQQEKEMENVRLPTRNRTPWDAGGYSLPINTLSLAPTPLQQANFEEQEHQQHEGEAPSSPKHKFSDSRSSLSSFTSSLQSATHSRFSSMSTVNSAQPMHGIPTEAFSPKLRNAPQNLELATIDSRSEHGPSTSLSPTGSLETLAFVAEHHPFSQQATRQGSQEVLGADSESVPRSLSTEIPVRGRSGRASSPSDGLLIKRMDLPSLRLNTEYADLNRSTQQQDGFFFSATPFDTQINSTSTYPPATLSTKLKSQHKRSSSAPDFLQAQRPPVYRMMSEIRRDSDMGINSPDHRDSSPLSIGQQGPFTSNIGRNNRSSSLSQPSGMRLERTMANGAIMGDPTPPSSLHPDHPSPTNITMTTPDTPPHAAADVPGVQHEVRCMFVADCDTNSQLRKAISHIFGRNKMCTRLIPADVWVHYCRKHYQRSRYRNPKEYAKLQCDLVQEQIRRIHDWSETNKINNKGNVIQDWSLAIRKREQKRIDELTSRKRRAETFDNEDMDDGMEDISGSAGPGVPQTAVPEWLRQKCSPGYDTLQILGIFNQLHHEVLEDKIVQFPDIEILPNITTESQETPKSPKGYAKRSTSTSTTSSHRRSQSLGVSMTPSYSSPDRRMSQPSAWGSDSSSAYSSPLQKRPRHNNGEGMQDRFAPPFQPGTRLRTHSIASHRQLFSNNNMGNIDENHVEEEPYGHDMSFRAPINGNGNYYPGSSPYQQPLPAPIPQRGNGMSMAAHLENTNDYMPGGRRSHGRSQSDVGGGFAASRMAYPAQQPASYAMDSRGMQTQNNMSNYVAQQQYRDHPAAAQNVRTDMRMAGVPSGHQRHSSNPMVMNQYQQYGRESQDYAQVQHDSRNYMQNMSNSVRGRPIREESSNLFAQRR